MIQKMKRGKNYSSTVDVYIKLNKYKSPVYSSFRPDLKLEPKQDSQAASTTKGRRGKDLLGQNRNRIRWSIQRM